MSEYIKKEDTIKYLNDLFGEMYHVSFGNVLQSLDSLQTYSFPDSAENKGEWIEESDNYGHSSYFCSRCGTQEGKPSDICPNCRARMSNSENPNKWIPVSERLPKIADVYRVTRYYPNNVMNPKYIVDACAFDGSDTWYNDNRINHERAYADNVIAWQENPEPYKADMRGE